MIVSSFSGVTSVTNTTCSREWADIQSQESESSLSPQEGEIYSIVTPGYLAVVIEVNSDKAGLFYPVMVHLIHKKTRKMDKIIYTINGCFDSITEPSKWDMVEKVGDKETNPEFFL
jgi:hypothetical protein